MSSSRGDAPSSGRRRPSAPIALIAAAGIAGAGLALQAQPAPIAAPVLKWQRGGCFASWCQTGWYGSPAVADLDEDGANEVIWGSYDVVALDGATGALKWRGPNGSRVWGGVAVADLTNDGTLEVIAGRGSNQLTVYDRNGNAIWTRNPFPSGEVRSMAVADLDGDGLTEMIAARAASGGSNYVNVYEPDGTVRPGWPARRTGEAGYGAGLYNQNVAVGSLDGSGHPLNVYVPTDTHYITALDPDGDQLPANAMYGAGKVWSQVGVHVDHAVDLRGYAICGSEHRPNFANVGPSIARLDLAGALQQLVVPGDVYDCAVGDGVPGDLFYLPWILNGDRSRFVDSTIAAHAWVTLPAPPPAPGPLSEDYNVIENSVSNAVIANLDPAVSSHPEILYASYDGRVNAYWLDRTQHGNWPFKVPGTGMRFAGEPVVADLNGDGYSEVIFTSWGEKATASIGQLHVLDWQGNPLHQITLPASFPAGSWNGGLGAPMIEDIDGDPDYELVIGTSHSGVVAYDLPGTANAVIQWRTGRGGLDRTGRAEPADRLVDEGFESGGWGAWTKVATDAGDLLHTGLAAMGGTAQGLAAIVDDTAPLFVQHDPSPAASSYRVRFYVDPNDFDTGAAIGRHRARLLIGYRRDPDVPDGPNLRQFAVILRYRDGQHAVGVRAYAGAAPRASTGFFELTEGPHWVEVEWASARSASSSTGRLRLWIDDVLVSTLSGLANHGTIGAVRLGALNVKAGAGGTIFFDELTSRRYSFIGPW
jgi:hypothetical protein